MKNTIKQSVRINGIDIEMNITNEIVKEYTDSLYSSCSTPLNDLRVSAEADRVPVIMRDTEELITALFRLKKPERVLEIGAAVGYSSCCFAEKCGCRVTTVEADEKMYKTAVSNISRLGFDDRVEVLQGDARQVLHDRAGSGRYTSADGEGVFDAVFIDAAKSHYRYFWDLSLPLCRKNALIVCDNVLMKGMTASDQYDVRKKYKTSIRKMRGFLEYITGSGYAKTCVLPVGDGVSISILERELI